MTEQLRRMEDAAARLRQQRASVEQVVETIIDSALHSNETAAVNRTEQNDGEKRYDGDHGPFTRIQFLRLFGDVDGPMKWEHSSDLPLKLSRFSPNVPAAKTQPIPAARNVVADNIQQCSCEGLLSREQCVQELLAAFRIKISDTNHTEAANKDQLADRKWFRSGKVVRLSEALKTVELFASGADRSLHPIRDARLSKNPAFLASEASVPLTRNVARTPLRRYPKCANPECLAHGQCLGHY